MNIISIPLLGFGIIFLLCSCSSQSLSEHPSGKEIVKYEDTNKDGRIDSETHTYPNAYDADWSLDDTNFDGKYDKEITQGVGIIIRRVSIPVPKSIKLVEQGAAANP